MGKNNVSSGWWTGQLWGDLSCTVSLGSFKVQKVWTSGHAWELPGHFSLSYMPHQFRCFYFYEEGREIYPYPLLPSSFKSQHLLLDYCISLLTFLASLLGISLLHHSQNVAVKTYSDHVTLLLPSASPSVKAKSLHLGHQGLTGLAQGFPTSTVLPLLHSPSWQWPSHWDLSIL